MTQNSGIERITDTLETPELDNRSYRVIRLPNKLEALLVHDPDTDKASASVSVNVGSFSDADDMPGMAHAVEHLLFMGTKKFPKENEYSQYLTAHSGHSNAYTAATQTNYFFEVAASQAQGEEILDQNASHVAPDPPLKGALDRFAQFFIAPLFLSSTLDRELKAVDSENKKNLQSDAWRLRQLDQTLSNPQHPFHHFSTGNLQTLRDEPRARGIDVRQEFMDFHARHYSANRMKLVVLGKERIDQLEQWVSELFADVLDKTLPQNRWDGPQQPYTPKELGSIIWAKPVMEARSLKMQFPFQDEDELYDSQPSHHLSHLIGHEGPGSILSYIKAKGWANGLSAGGATLCPGTGFFSISIQLTEEGLSRYQEVVRTIFQYIAMIREQKPQRWISDEMRRMGEVDFRFQEKTPASAFTSSMSSTMQKPLPRERLLSALEVFRTFDPAGIEKALSYLSPENFRLMITSREVPGNWNEKEKWYGTEYRLENIPDQFIEDLKAAASADSASRPPELHLPHVNEFIPTRLVVDRKLVESPATAPNLIRDDDSVRCWWKKDDTFWVPKGSVSINLRNPLAAATPACAVKSRLFCELVKDALNEYSYNAEIAGLEYSLTAYQNGLAVDIAGYNDKIPVLLEKVLISMRDLHVHTDRFAIVKERLARGFRNWDFQQPYHQVGEFSAWLSGEKKWIVKQYISELENVQPVDIEAFYPQLLQQIHVELFCHGNIDKQAALHLAGVVESTLKFNMLPQTQWPIKRNFVLPPGGDYIYPQHLNDPANVNNCVEYFLQIGPLVDRSLKAKALLLGQLTEEAGFNQLRTKEQLGYVVWTGVKVSQTMVGYRVIIQSERTTEYLEERINAFLALFATSLQDQSTAEFEALKKSLIAKRLEKLKNLQQESSRIWNYISTEYYDFYQRQEEISYIEKLTKDDMIQFYQQYIHPESKTRAKLSVHLKAQTSLESVAATLTPEQQQIQLTSILQQSLSMMGIDAEGDMLSQRLSKLDLSDGSIPDILEVLKSHLRDDAKAPEDQIEEILSQGPQLLQTLLPSLGIRNRVSNTEEDNNAATLPPCPPMKESTIVHNVREFQASLSVSAGPLPITTLEAFRVLDETP